jgi:hypothetical protein
MCLAMQFFILHMQLFMHHWKPFLAFFEFCYLSEECSQWQQYQKLLQAHQQYSTVQEVHPAIYLGISFS